MCSIYLLLIILIPSYTSHELKAAKFESGFPNRSQNSNPAFPVAHKIEIPFSHSNEKFQDELTNYESSAIWINRYQ